MSKYGVGDKVVIRKDLVVGEVYGGFEWWSVMNYLKEKEYVVIKRVDEDDDYVVEDGWYINDEMIAGLYDEVTVTNELKLFEVCYLDENFNEHQFLKVAINEESALELVNDSMVNIFATEITEVDGYKIKLCK